MTMVGIKRFFNALLRDIQRGDPAAIGIVVAAFVGLLTLFLILRLSRKSKLRDILLLGISDSGKTLLFSQLVYKCFKESFTSAAPNTGTYIVPERKTKVELVDIPGHERIREQFLEKQKGLARAIIFVVDSGTLQKEIKEVAEFLYTVLIDRTVSSNGLPVLVLCNKQDLTLSKGASVIKGQLEKEMNTLRITKAAALQGVGDAGNNNTFLGSKNKDFAFEDIRSNRVEFGECSALGQDKNSNKPELDFVYEWIASVS